MNIRKASLSELQPPEEPKERKLTPRQLANLERENQFKKVFAQAEKSPTGIWAIESESPEKPQSLRVALTKAIAVAGWQGHMRQKGTTFYLSMSELPRTRGRG